MVTLVLFENVFSKCIRSSRQRASYESKREGVCFWMKTHVLWVPGVNLAIDLTICYVWQIRKRCHVEWKVCFWVSG